MLNPFIYRLRNKDVKGAPGGLLGQAASCQRWVTGLRTRQTLGPRGKCTAVDIRVLLLPKGHVTSSISRAPMLAFMCFCIIFSSSLCEWSCSSLFVTCDVLPLLSFLQTFWRPQHKMSSTCIKCSHGFPPGHPLQCLY